MGHAGYASLYFLELGDINKELDTCLEFLFGEHVNLHIFCDPASFHDLFFQVHFYA